MSDRFDSYSTNLDGLIVLQRKLMKDKRGYLERLYCADELRQMNLSKPVAQINHTLTHNIGTVRGLHFQYPPSAETKIVSCIKGRIFDVAVDVRQDSSTFLCWFGEILSEDNLKSMLIPDGFAHGFQTLTSDSEVLYFSTEFYDSQSEGGMHPQDPRLGITWPIPVTELSERDAAHSLVDDSFRGVSFGE